MCVCVCGRGASSTCALRMLVKAARAGPGEWNVLSVCSFLNLV